MAMLSTQALTPGMINDLSAQYDQMMNPMLQSTGDPAMDAKRQEMYAQNAAMQQNQPTSAPLRVHVGTVPIPENEMIAPPMDTMTMPQTNAMLTKQPENLLDAVAAQIAAPKGEQPLGQFVSGNWQDLLRQGVAGLEENAMRENLPADVYMKMKTIENEKTLAEQNQFLNNLKLQADLDYQKQSIDLKKEELAMERQKVLTGGESPSAVREYQFYSGLDPDAQRQYLSVKRAQQVLDLGPNFGVLSPSGAVTPVADKGLSPEALPETRQAQASASEVGKELGAAEAKLNAMESALPGLYEVTDKLSKLGKIATYTNAGQARDTALRELGMDIPDAAVARTAFITTIDNEVLPLLRDTFGAAFTVEEGNRLRSTLGNENLSPKEKDAALKSFIDAKTREIRKLQRQTGKETSSPVSSTTRLKFNPATGDFE